MSDQSASVPEEGKTEPHIPTEQEILEKLSADERCTAYLAKYNDYSRESFIKSYAQYKHIWWKNGSYYLDWVDKANTRWIDEARKQLELIQQKKLFDAQCLWRAEQLKLPEIELCFDFHLWSDKGLQCPFIDPVTPEEVDLYINYLADRQTLPDSFHWNLQNYEQLKKATGNEEENDSEELPDWYEYHNLYTGNGSYMSLPDIRGNKERFYLKIANANDKPAEAAPPRVTDDRPSIHFYDEEHLDPFVKAFEDSQTREYYNAYKKFRRFRDAEGNMEELMQDLLAAGEPIAVEAHPDFRQALRNAWEKYEVQKVIEFLPYALDEHRFSHSMGFGFSQDTEKPMFNPMEIRDAWKERLIKGRELNGEPADLNF